MTDIEALRLRLGTGIDYQTFDLDALAPLTFKRPAAETQTPAPPSSPPAPTITPQRQAFGPVSAPLVTTPTPALAFTQYAERPAGSLVGGTLLVDLFKRLEAHAR